MGDNLGGAVFLLGFVLVIGIVVGLIAAAAVSHPETGPDFHDPTEYGWSVASSFDLHRERRALFGRDVDSYDDGRPGYPDEVYERLVDVCGLGPGTSVLEIGPGTGQATSALLGRGASVVAVELSESLGARPRRSFRATDWRSSSVRSSPPSSATVAST